MATIIYLHGFLSVGNSYKAEAIQESLPEHTVLAPTLPVNPLDVITVVNQLIKDATSFPIIFVGTSLGGFYANYFGQKNDCPAVLVNPATSPSVSLVSSVGSTTNHVSGKVEDFHRSYLDQLESMESDIADLYSGALVSIFLALDDDVIPAQTTLDKYPYTASTEVFNDGGHRFTSNWQHVIARVKTLVT